MAQLSSSNPYLLKILLPFSSSMDYMGHWRTSKLQLTQHSSYISQSHGYPGIYELMEKEQATFLKRCSF